MSINKPLVRVTLPLAGGNALTQAARTIMSTVGPVIAVQYGLSAGELGLFSAAMFASYCLAQMPVGIALDRWGPRRVQTILCFVTAAGFALFALSTSVPGFVLGRLLTGIGIAAGLIALIKGNSEWFPRHEVAKATGLGMMVGTLGSFLATAPAQALLPLIGWHGVIWCCMGASLLVGMWNLLSVRDQNLHKVSRPLLADIKELTVIIRAPAFRSFAPMASLLTILNFTYLGLWAGPWLRDVAHFGPQARANVLVLYTVGLLISAPLAGSLVSATQRHKRHAMLVPAICTVGVIAVQVALICLPVRGFWVAGLWFAFALFGGSGSAAYSAVTSYFPATHAGRVSTAINTVSLAGVFALQIIIGQFVDLWPRTPDGGWSAHGYSLGLALTIILQIAALAYAWWQRNRVKTLA